MGRTIVAVLSIAIYKVVWWDKNVKTTFQEEELNRCAVETKVGAKHRFFKIPVQFGVKMFALLSFGNL